MNFDAYFDQSSEAVAARAVSKLLAHSAEFNEIYFSDKVAKDERGMTLPGCEGREWMKSLIGIEQFPKLMTYNSTKILLW